MARKVVIICLALFLFFPVWRVVCQQMPSKETKGLIEMKEINWTEFWAGLGNKIEKRNSDLREIFRARNVKAMYEKFGEDLILFTPQEGIMCRGQEGFKRFFEMIPKVEDVTFKTLDIFVRPVKASRVIEGKTYDYVVFEIGEYSISHNPSNADGSFIHLRGHIDGCWDRER